MIGLKKRKISPLIIIVLSFLGIIIVGMFLFKLPFSAAEGHTISWVDALFTSTSAVCVTGLSTIPNVSETLSTFGEILLAVLIQIGGLGIITIAIYVLMLLGIKIGITERYVIKEALNQPTMSGMVRLVRKIVLTTLTIEAFGLIINMIVFAPDMPFFEALGLSAFHSISAFNNAGFDLFGASSMQAYSDNLLLNINTMVQIIIGGIGFIVIEDVLTKKRWKTLTLYSKVVIKTSIFLIIFGTIIIKLFAYSDITWLEAVFQSVTTRTAGFSTVDMNLFSYTTLSVILVMMFIGASPNSTGGGIKTSTFYIAFKSTISYLRGKPTIIHKRKINDDNRTKAFTLIVLALVSVFVIFIAVSAIEQRNPNAEMPFMKVLFETISAFGTVGLSMGVTSELMSASKILLALLMFVGRLGPITLFGITNTNWGRPHASTVTYATEKVLIG